MSELFHGIDVAEVGRIEEMVRRHGERFLGRVFTELERAYAGRYRRQGERLAGRFAVKEAVMKLLGTGWRNGIAWTDVETVNDGHGRPGVVLRGEALRLAQQAGVGEMSVSITHAGGMAMASVVALKSETR